jgi:hypothetical protein
VNPQTLRSNTRLLKSFTLRAKNSFLRRIQRLGIFVDLGQFWNESTEDKHPGKTKLLIVAPGYMTIPTNGWGAVEIIVSETLSLYAAAGFDVWVLNSRNRKKWREAKKINFPIILSHSDIDNPRIRSNWPNAKILGVSHYGLGAYPEKWDKGFEKILIGMKKCDVVICLSKAVAATFSNYIPLEKILISPNGSAFESHCVLPGEINKIICLGKVEKRKKQFELWKSLRTSNLEITFAGPIVDERVTREIERDPTLANAFIGPISRENLITELGKYTALILISDGEADALVLYEAQLAGLPVLVTERSLGSQNPELDWICVISESPTSEEIHSALSGVISSPSNITKYALENYNWAVRNKKLVSLLLDLSN